MANFNKAEKTVFAIKLLQYQEEFLFDPRMPWELGSEKKWKREKKEMNGPEREI
jgi:hypothetical protein